MTGDHGVVGKTSRDLHASEVLQRDGNVLALQLVVDNLEDVRTSVVDTNRVAWQRENVCMFSGHDGDADIHVWQELEVVIVDGTSCFADVAGAAQLHRRRDCGDAAVPGPSRNCVPGKLNLLPGNQTAHIGFVDEDAD